MTPRCAQDPGILATLDAYLKKTIKIFDDIIIIGIIFVNIKITNYKSTTETQSNDIDVVQITRIHWTFPLPGLEHRMK